MSGFYIASFPSTPYRYEVGYINLRDLMTSDPTIVVHFYLEYESGEVEKILESIIHFFKAYHDLESIPGKILLNVSLIQITMHIHQSLNPVSNSWFSWLSWSGKTKQ